MIDQEHVDLLWQYSTGSRGHDIEFGQFAVIFTLTTFSMISFY